MHIAPSPDDRSALDLTARARIRDAAVERFAVDGFNTPFRVIAAAAGVSPGLITHHFGSKAALRAECDREVLRRHAALKSEALDNPHSYLLEKLATPGPAAQVLVYMLRAVHAGGAPARAFLESLVDQLRGVMADGVASGLIRPSRDEEARLRYLADQTIGTMLVRFLLSPGLTPDEFTESLHAGRDDTILPILELYTEGLLASSEMLDTYVQHLVVHDAHPPPHTPAADPR